MENQCKVAHHTFGSFPGKSPKQDKLLLSEPKNAITHKNEGSKAMIVALQSDERRRVRKLFFLFNTDKRTLCSKI